MYVPLLLAPLVGFAAASTNVPAAPAAPLAADVSAACKAIEAAIPGQLVYQGDKAYAKENGDYYAYQATLMKPGCIAQPRSAEATSKIVKVLNEHPTVKFAIKSGGHNPNLGFSSSSGQVLIAMSQLNGTTYDKSRNVAYIKPGGRWGDVIKALEPDDVAVAGGRLEWVGLGGYLTEGGNSYLSAEYGMAADNVVEFETVFANGSIIKVTRENNPDLMKAMRGSGNQYGIVTQFTVKAHPMTNVWGGIRVYSVKQRDELFKGLHDFININTQNQKAAIIFNASPTRSGPGTYAVFMYYHGGEAPPDGYFGSIQSIKPLLDFTGVVPYAKLLGGDSIKQSGFPGVRTAFRSITLPWVEGYPEWYAKIEDTFVSIAKQHNPEGPEGLVTLAFQPWPTSFGIHAEAAGGNCMGLTAQDKPRFVLEMAQLWGSPSLDAKLPAMLQDLTESLNQQKEEIMNNKEYVGSDGVETYLPFFANDAHTDQDVLGSWKDFATFKALQKENDPKGFWSRWSGTWNYNGVDE